ncbi:PEP-CTERM sorting domain-containing protein, partial [bacterium]|nr:PEP-CTERM sorting domain-containing protein [bacterium]
YVAAGGIKSLDTNNDDFTWAFWAKQNPSQPVNSDVILGNRRRAGGGDAEFTKFTPGKFEYKRSPSAQIDYANIPSDDVWYHHAVVKSGSTLTYYRDGSPAGTATATSTTPANPFNMGGDPFTEPWQGRLDDVALFDTPLTQTQVVQAMNGNFAPFQVLGTGVVALSDDFSGSSVDTTKWQVIEKGLQVQGAGTAPNFTATVSGGQLTIAGTVTNPYWSGLTLRSVTEFSTEYDTTFAVDRMSLAVGTGRPRSSIWIWSDDSHFLHFSHNPLETGWQYNWNDVGGLGGDPVGGGVNIAALDGEDDDLGAHGMMLAFLPSAGNSATIEMYFDGQLVASQAFTNWTPDTFQVMITGQARAIGDTVSAVFDNAMVIVMPEPTTLTLLGLGGLLAARRRRRKA